VNNPTTPEGQDPTKLTLKLYVTGMSAKSMEAIKNIKQLCDTYVKDNFDLEIIDLYKNPEAAQTNQVVFSPSLVKVFPLPRKTLIGNFSDENKVIQSLNISTDK
jgi:circadian clock protein KaiB